MPTKRNVLTNAPSLLHTVALVGPSHEDTVRNIRQMDIASPPSLYEPARQLIHKVLGGQTYEWAMRQAELLPDLRERKCAIAVLKTARAFLLSTKPDWFRPLDIEQYQLSADVQVPVRVDGLMKVGDEVFIVCLHLWERRLSIEQIRAAIAVISNRLSQREELAAAKLEFVDLSVDPAAKGRLLRRVSWDTYSLMFEYELERFMIRLLNAWIEYYADPAPRPERKPRPPKDGQQDMFSPDGG